MPPTQVTECAEQCYFVWMLRNVPFVNIMEQDKNFAKELPRTTRIVSVLQRITASFLRAFLWLIGFWLCGTLFLVVGLQAGEYGFTGIARVAMYASLPLSLIGIIMFIVSFVAGLATRN